MKVDVAEGYGEAWSQGWRGFFNSEKWDDNPHADEGGFGLWSGWNEGYWAAACTDAKRKLGEDGRTQ